MDEHKLLSFTVLGVVVLVALLSVALLLTDSNKTGYTIIVAPPPQKVYGGAIYGDPYPNFNGRLENGIAGTNQAESASSETPGRNHARNPQFNVPSAQTITYQR